MAYFPAFLKLDNRKILLVGGGHIACEKLLHLLDFTNYIDIIAQDISQEMMLHVTRNGLTYEQRAYKEGDIKGYDIVVVAVDDIELQKNIYNESKEYNCLCNSVDSIDYCDFIFPSYVKKGDLTIAISTSGASPAMAKQLRIYFQKILPNGISEFLQEMKALRKRLPKGKERMQILEEKANEYMQKFLHV